MKAIAPAQKNASNPEGNVHAADRPLDAHFASRALGLYGVPATDRAGLARLLLRWRLDHLRQTVRLAAGSVHYDALLDRAALAAAGAPGWSPAADTPVLAARSESGRLCRDFDALLALLPRTFPRDLAAAPETFLAVGQSDVEGVVSLPTSGTTGPGKRIFCTEGDMRETADFFAHGMRYMVNPAAGDRVVLLMSGERPGSVGDLLGRGMAALGVGCAVPGFLPPDTAQEDAFLRNLAGLMPTCLVGVPGHILALARHPGAVALSRSVHTVLLSGDTVTPALRQAIVRGLGCRVFVHYGLTETGFGGAVECLQRDGCHMREADLCFEILDPGGVPVPDGVWGEIAVTTLTRRAMPLLRYCTGDSGMIRSDASDPCSCGSLFRRLVPGGRLSHLVPVPGDRPLSLVELGQTIHALPWVRGFTPILHEPDAGGPCLALRILLRADAPSTATATVEDAVRRHSGLRVVRSPEEQARCPADCLPVLVRATSPATGGRPTATQAKLHLERTQAPLSWSRQP